MMLELAREMSKVDGDLSLRIGYSDGSYSLSVYVSDLGDIYSFTSTDVAECYKRIQDFIECLKDEERFFNLVREVETKPLEAN